MTASKPDSPSFAATRARSPGTCADFGAARRPRPPARPVDERDGARTPTRTCTKLGRTAGGHRQGAENIPAFRPGRRTSAYPRQQADARRLRSGAHGGDHPDGLPIGGYRFQPTLSNRNRPDCLILFPNGVPASSSTPSSRWRPGTPSARGRRAGSGSSPRASFAATSQSISGHRRALPGPRRDPGHGLHVRAVGIDLRRHP